MANYNVRFSIRLNTGNIEANDWLFKNGETTAPEESLKAIAALSISLYLKEHKLEEFPQVTNLIKKIFAVLVKLLYILLNRQPQKPQPQRS